MPGEKPRHFWRAQQQAPAPTGKFSATQHHLSNAGQMPIGRNPYVREWAHFLSRDGKRMARRNIKIIANNEMPQHYKKHCCFHPEMSHLHVDKVSRQVVLSITATHSMPFVPQRLPTQQSFLS